MTNLVKINLPKIICEKLGLAQDLLLEAENFEGLLAGLFKKYPGLADLILDKNLNELRKGIAVFINRQLVNQVSLKDFLLSKDDCVSFVVAYSGG